MNQCFEPFGTTDSNRKLFIGRNKVSIEETNNDVQTTVKYFHVTEKKKKVSWISKESSV